MVAPDAAALVTARFYGPRMTTARLIPPMPGLGLERELPAATTSVSRASGSDFPLLGGFRLRGNATEAQLDALTARLKLSPHTLCKCRLVAHRWRPEQRQPVMDSLVYVSFTAHVPGRPQ